MTVRLPVAFTGGATFVSQYLDDAIKGWDSYKWWIQADSESGNVSLDGSGGITNFLDVKSKLSVFERTSGVAAPLAGDALGGYSGATFDGTGLYAATTGYPSHLNLAQPFTLAAIVVPTFGGANRYLLSRFQSTTDRTAIIMTSDGLITFSHGGASLSLPGVSGRPTLVVCGSNGVSNFLNVNGVSATPIATPNTQNTQRLALGGLYPTGTVQSPYNGVLLDLIAHQEQYVTHSDKLGVVQRFAVNVYGVPFVPLAP